MLHKHKYLLQINRLKKAHKRAKTERQREWLLSLIDRSKENFHKAEWHPWEDKIRAYIKDLQCTRRKAEQIITLEKIKEIFENEDA